jgi:hypothetical protein
MVPVALSRTIIVIRESGFIRLLVPTNIPELLMRRSWLIASSFATSHNSLAKRQVAASQPAVFLPQTLHKMHLQGNDSRG